MTTETMPAAVYVGDGAIEVQRVQVPDLGPDQVRIAVSHCGICGTDLHLVLENMGRPGSGLGHEWAGTIAAVGERVTGWQVGDRVVAGPGPGCGECRACRRGRPAVCLNRSAPAEAPTGHRGAFAQYTTVAAERLLRIPDSLSTRAAALTEPTAVAIHAVTLSGVTPEDRVLVTGAGPVGLLVSAVLRARGVHDITVSEPAPARRERALAVGAARVVTPEDLPAATRGARAADPFSVVFECSGRGEAAEAGLDQLDYAGTFVFVGTSMKYPRVNHNRVIIFESTIIGAYNYDADGFAPALELLASGKMPLDALIEPDDVLLDGLFDVMQRCAAGEMPGKVMIRPEIGGEFEVGEQEVPS
jgi:(R,R)-butanediol dehydrogenase/meso-butanediol dehydrogenase/diacetyl reductase